MVVRECQLGIPYAKVGYALDKAKDDVRSIVVLRARKTQRLPWVHLPERYLCLLAGHAPLQVSPTAPTRCPLWGRGNQEKHRDEAHHARNASTASTGTTKSRQPQAK